MNGKLQASSAQVSSLASKNMSGFTASGPNAQSFFNDAPLCSLFFAKPSSAAANSARRSYGRNYLKRLQRARLDVKAAKETAGEKDLAASTDCLYIGGAKQLLTYLETASGIVISGGLLKPLAGAGAQPFQYAASLQGREASEASPLSLSSAEKLSNKEVWILKLALQSRSRSGVLCTTVSDHVEVVLEAGVAPSAWSHVGNTQDRIHSCD